MAKVDLSQLNELQKEAVLYNTGPLTILSVAGSGKTRTLTTKIAYIVEELEVRPTRVWACTFTKKAAGEMQERLAKLIGDKAELVKMSTIHSMAFKIWRQGMRSKEPWWESPKILTNEGTAQSHLFKYLKDNNFVYKDAKEFLAKISIIKLSRTTPKDIKNELEASYNEPIPWDNPQKLTWQQALYCVFNEYEKWKVKRNYIDFSDMLLNCINMLEDKRFADYTAKVQNSVEYLLVDEAQDTNGVAFQIMKIIGDKHRNISMIGDLRQSIYSFQGAEIQNMHSFIKEYKPKMINLNVNYRSSKTIVENANEVIKYSREVIGEPAITPNPVGDKIELHGNIELINEGAFILEKIQELKATEDIEWRDIAILYRVHSQSREIEDNFLLNDIPYVIFTKTSFYNRKEIKDLLSYLELAINPYEQDIKVFKRIANRPVRYIQTATLNRVEEIADDLEISPYKVMEEVWDYDLEPREIKQIDQLMGDIVAVKRQVENGKTTQELFRFILENLGYKDWAINDKKVKEADDDIELNFESLISSVHKFYTPESFLDFVAEVKEAEKKKKDENGDYIKMMSIHASKGKEFKYVFIVGMCDRTYPFYKAVEEGKEDEERRLMYVALTRPKERLYLCSILHNMGRFKVRISPYLNQMKVNLKDMQIHDMVSLEEIKEFKNG
jgi:DNA helicase-2/ATP-dependent DNA helicase PcrA